MKDVIRVVRIMRLEVLGLGWWNILFLVVRQLVTWHEIRNQCKICSICTICTICTICIICKICNPPLS